MDQSIVSQREINVDTESYVTVLRASLRQSPDVILLGEMRDYETMQVAMTAAEPGHLHRHKEQNSVRPDGVPPLQGKHMSVCLGGL